MPTKLLSIASPPASGIPYTDTNSNLEDADDVQEALDNAGEQLSAVDSQLAQYTQYATKARTLIVSPLGGDYNTLSAALASITDAAADKQYHILVIGDISETVGIAAKSYVHVSGIAGASVTVTMTDATIGFTFDSIVSSTWRNLIMKRAGAVVANYAYAVIVKGTCDNTVVLDNCSIKNITTLGAAVDHRVGLWVEGTADPVVVNCIIRAADGANYGMGLIISGTAKGLYDNCICYGGQGSPNCWGIYIINQAAPKFINCTGIGGNGGTYCYGGYSREGTSPTFHTCVFYGGNGGAGCNGFYASDGSAPIFHNCAFIGGAGGVNCRGIDIDMSAAPYLMGITTTPPILSTYHALTETTTIVLHATQPHQIKSISFNVVTAAAGQTVSVGTTLGGTEIINAQSIATTGYKTVTLGSAAKNPLAANATLYVTFSGGGFVLLRPTIFISNAGCYGINIDSTNVVIVDNATIIANCASYGVVVSAGAVTANKLRFTNCHIESLIKNASSLQSFACSAAYNDAPVYNCTIITGALNLTAKAAASTNGTNQII